MSQGQQTKRGTDDVLEDWNDLTSGLALLWMGPGGPTSDLAERARRHMELQQVHEMQHVCALMMNDMRAQGRPVPDGVQRKWSELAREWHRDFCQDEGCVERRGGRV